MKKTYEVYYIGCDDDEYITVIRDVFLMYEEDGYLHFEYTNGEKSFNTDFIMYVYEVEKYSKKCIITY